MYRSPNLQGTPFLTENAESDIFDGLQIQFTNHWVVKDSSINWVGKNAYVVQHRADEPSRSWIRRSIGYAPSGGLRNAVRQHGGGHLDPRPFPYDVPIPTKFRIFNRTEGRYIEVLLRRRDGLKNPSMIEPLDELILAEPNPRGQLGPTWDLFFLAKPGEPRDTLTTSGATTGW